jgi:hypothetical protein
MRYYLFLNLAIIFFILAAAAVIGSKMPQRIFIEHTMICLACLVISLLFFKLKDKTWKELIFNLKQDLKMDGDYI